MEKPKIDQETVKQMVEIAQRLNYGIQLKLKDGSVNVYSLGEIAESTRDEIKVLLPKGITYSNIESVAAVAKK